jgi:hypothetical protein
MMLLMPAPPLLWALRKHLLLLLLFSPSSAAPHHPLHVACSIAMEQSTTEQCQRLLVLAGLQLVLQLYATLITVYAKQQ